MNNDDRVMLAHGGGGELTRTLLSKHILPKLGNEFLDPLFDSALLPPIEGKICFTTDAFVVQPLFFPGGDIGRLAVCGTINDLAVMGARPLVLSLALVLEEGLRLPDLDRVIDSIAEAAKEAGVRVVTGDTKVVERRGEGGMTVTTAGIGVMWNDFSLGTGRIEPGDAVLISGGIAEHGLAVLSAREGLGLSTEIRSDAAPLAGLVADLLDECRNVRFIRDPTRGGVAGLLADLVEESGYGVEILEESIPITPAVRHASELLGLDPLTVANEGKIVVVVAADEADRALAACRAHPLGRDAAAVGRIVEANPPLPELVTRIGGRLMIRRPYGEELPRIC